jgi:hypothetical protein
MSSTPVRFRSMTYEDQRAAIQRLAVCGLADSEIARLIEWHVTDVRRCIAEHRVWTHQSRLSQVK